MTAKLIPCPDCDGTGRREYAIEPDPSKPDARVGAESCERCAGRGTLKVGSKQAGPAILSQASDAAPAKGEVTASVEAKLADEADDLAAAAAKLAGEAADYAALSATRAEAAADRADLSADQAEQAAAEAVPTVPVPADAEETPVAIAPAPDTPAVAPDIAPATPDIPPVATVEDPDDTE